MKLIMTVIIMYHSDMERHAPSYTDHNHPECPSRYTVIYDRLRKVYDQDPRILFIEARQATDTELHKVHTEKYVSNLGTNLKSLTYRNPDLYYNEWTYRASLLAAGAATQLVDTIALTDNMAGFAIVRPPGHHAECSSPKGFCYINNVMVAALNVIHLVKRILIVDWDVHYHFGTADIINKHPELTPQQLTVFSMHRFDNGRFYPRKKSGATGVRSKGRIVNHGFNGYADDQQYISVLQSFLERYRVEMSASPDVIIVSCGFDAAKGDPIGGFGVTPNGYYEMTKMLHKFCPKLALILEGGYNLDVLPECAQACIAGLL